MYYIQTYFFCAVSKIRGLDLDPNTFSDNDNYKLQDLSIGYDSGMQHNGYTEDIAKTKNVEKKKQAERKNIHRSFFKTGKEKVRTNNYKFLFPVLLRDLLTILCTEVFNTYNKFSV